MTLVQEFTPEMFIEQAARGIEQLAEYHFDLQWGLNFDPCDDEVCEYCDEMYDEIQKVESLISMYQKMIHDWQDQWYVMRPFVPEELA